MSLNLKSINKEMIEELSSLISIRNHLAFLLNNGSRTLVSKEDTRKISVLISEIDKHFLMTTLSQESSLASHAESKGFIKYGDSTVVENGAVFISHPQADEEKEDKQLSFVFESKNDDELKDNNLSDLKKSDKKVNNKKQSKKLFKRSDD